MSQAIRDAARALLDSNDRGEGCSRIDLENALRAVLSAPQPTADEQVAEHMRLVREACIAWGEWAHDNDPDCAKESAAILAVESSARALLNAGRDDAEMLDAFEAQINWELSFSWEAEENEPWQIHAVTGGRSDREWRLVSKGKTAREAIRAAMKGTP